MAAALAVPGTEIVAVDAMQVYRGMDIGTAKPTPADRAAVPPPRHRPRRADRRLRGHRVPRAPTTRRWRRSPAARCSSPAPGCTSPPSSTASTCPASGPRCARRLEAEPDVARCGPGSTPLDPVAAGRIEPGNRRRIVRALEVTEGSGRPFSSYGPGLARLPADRRRADRPALVAAGAGRTRRAAGGGDDRRRAARRGRAAPRRRTVAHGRPGARLQGADRPPRGAGHARRGDRRDRRCAPASSPSGRSGGSVATRAYAGSTSTATRSPSWLPVVIAALQA